ncbi:hypothetical protein [Pedobacter sp. FW305-3-2-15-E-R2A2]|uniref:hypothetical protein n=1 Tax=Pedobacter sp. FW305-3-2-15-E-R2A2 TaxID=3140251 RepID=UPI00313FFE1C
MKTGPKPGLKKNNSYIAHKSIIAFGFIKLNKPRIILNPGIVRSLESLHAAIQLMLSTSMSNLKLVPTMMKLSLLIEGKLPGILEFEDNINGFIFGKGCMLKENIEGYVWANNVWDNQNLHALEEHAGHSAISNILYAEFKLTKLFDFRYASNPFLDVNNFRQKR